MTELRPWLRDVTAGLLRALRVTDPQRRAHDRLTIVTFHSVLPVELRAQAPLPGLVVTPEELDWLLAFFTQNYECGALATQADVLAGGGRSSRPLLAVTFDDGQWDNFGYARDVLARHRVRASFYVPVDAIMLAERLWHDRLAWATQALLESRRAELLQLCRSVELDVHEGATVRSVVSAAKKLGPEARAQLVRSAESLAGAQPPDWTRLMNWTEVAMLAGEGHEIGSHSMTHALLPQCDESALRQEIEQSRALLREKLGVPVDSFCYPDGAYDARCPSELKRAGYRWAVTTKWGMNARDAQPYELRRHDMHPDYLRTREGDPSEARLQWRMSGLHPGLRH